MTSFLKLGIVIFTTSDIMMAPLRLGLLN